jgi:hypothetical protein
MDPVKKDPIPEPKFLDVLPSQLRDKWFKASKKEKNEIMVYFYEYVI